MSSVIKVTDGGLVATMHLPRQSGRRPAVIVLSGSDGGVATANLFGVPLLVPPYFIGPVENPWPPESYQRPF